jgi:hypothetical protein
MEAQNTREVVSDVDKKHCLSCLMIEHKHFLDNPMTTQCGNELEEFGRDMFKHYYKWAPHLVSWEYCRAFRTRPFRRTRTQTEVRNSDSD